MSGGSLEYLYSRDVTFIIENLQYLEKAAQKLTELDAEDVAKEIEDLICYSKQFKRRFETRWNRVKDIIHVIEWIIDCDFSPEQLKEPLMKYRGEQ